MKLHPNARLGLLRRLPLATIIAAAVAFPLFLAGAPGIHRPPAPKLSSPPALYTEPVTVSITARETGSEIYTSRDGSIPTRDGGQPYDPPLRIETTTVLRVVGVRPWIADSHVATASFLFPGQVAWQPPEPEGFPLSWHGNHLDVAPAPPVTPDYAMDHKAVADPARYAAAVNAALWALRTVSITADTKDLFDLDSGIFVNSTQEGDAWERPVSIELFQKDGTLAFQENAGIRIHGMSSRLINLNPKLGFRILFRRDYGNGQLRYPIFGPNRKTGFDALILRNLTQDSWVTRGNPHFAPPHYIREQFASNTQRAMGHPAIEAEFVHVYLNGLYWGIYSLCERIDGSFLSDRLGGSPHDVDIVKDGAIELGTQNAWNRVDHLSRRKNDTDALAEIETLVDLDNLIDYVLINQFTDNIDWFSVNSVAARTRKNGGKFLFFVYDAEMSFGAREPDLDYLDFARVARKFGFSFSPMQLFHRLQLYPDFQVRVADRIQRHYFNGGALTVESARRRWNDLAQTLDVAIVAESARWGDANDNGITRTREADWLPAIAHVSESFFPERTVLLMEHYRVERMLLPVEAPAVSPRGGTVLVGAEVTLTANETDILFTLDGSDPRASGGAVNGASARRYDGPIALTQACVLKARARNGSEWSALSTAEFQVTVANIR